MNQALFEDSWNENIKRFRSPFAYRGLSEDKEKIKSSLMKLGGNYSGMEKHLLRNFRKYAHRDVVEHDSTWNWLSLAKHHGLPTRLLDWTFSPYVAMHFLTANIEKYNHDGVIWLLIM